MSFRNWKDVLWPFGGTVLGLVVVPSVIAQYPEFFNENEWMLPASVGVVVFSWIIPLFLHDRTRRIYSYIVGIRGYGYPLFAILCLAVAAGCTLGFGALLRFHINHLRAATIVPSLTWTEPSPIDDGTPLTNKQLNATASVEGNFVYNPTYGATLAVGTDTLSVTFWPKKAAKYPERT